VTTFPRKSVLALGVVSALMAGAFFAVAAPSVANASTSSSISSIISKLNSYRKSHSTYEALGRNAFIDLDAEEYAKQYASDPGGNLDDFTPPTPLPLDAASDEPGSVTSDEVTASTSGAVAEIVADFIANDSGEITGGNNYIGIGFTTKGSHAYAYLVLAAYTHAPLNRITPGTATIPSTLHNGKSVKVTVHGFSSGVTLSYSWYSNGSLFGSNEPVASLQDGNFGDKVHVVVTASKTGFANSSVTSNTSKPVGLGTPDAPSHLQVTGFRNVGQTLTGPGLNADGWGPYFLNEYTYQWLRNGVAISGATSQTYELATADYGKRVDLRMSVTGADYLVATRETHTTSLVGHPLLHEVGPLLINGGDEAWGTTRTAGWDIFIEGVHYTLKWLISGHTVGTGFSYTPGVSDAGKQLSVEVTGHLAGFAATSFTSPVVDVLKKGFSASPDATISGGTGPGASAENGDTLVATMTQGSTPAATSYSYQWYLGTTPVKGATHKTFKVDAKTAILEVGFSVTAHRAGYTSSTFGTDISFD
jgi:hypothetical protein